MTWQTSSKKSKTGFELRKLITASNNLIWDVCVRVCVCVCVYVFMGAELRDKGGLLPGAFVSESVHTCTQMCVCIDMDMKTIFFFSITGEKPPQLITDGQGQDV